VNRKTATRAAVQLDMLGHVKNCNHYETTSKVHQEALRDLFDFEMASHGYTDPFEFTPDERKYEVRQAIEQAWVMVFNQPKSKPARKFMLVVWQFPDNYTLYTWKDGKLKVVAQNREWFDRYFPVYEDDDYKQEFGL